jgi:hypothetical protein
MTRWRNAALALLALLLLGGATFGRPEHPHFAWEEIPDVYALLGFAGACLLIFVFRGLGERLLQRRENYYEERGE